MRPACLTDILMLGAVTGMRSMSGLTAVAFTRTGPLKRIMPLLAIGEMIGDKTAFVGDRTDPAPLAGRAALGALVGGAIAYEHRSSVPAGVLLGGIAAVVAAHLAFRIRARVPEHAALAGAIEDAIVVAIGAGYAARTVRRAP